MLRECDAAAARVRAHLERKRRRSATAALEFRWTGAVRHGPEALGALDAHVAEAVASPRTLTLTLAPNPNTLTLTLTRSLSLTLTLTHNPDS